MYEGNAFHVVYLTGQPASGKSSVAAMLERSVQPIQIISYSTLLKDYINTQNTEALTTEDLRRQSAHRVRPEDIAAVDQILIELVNAQRHTTHIVVDSHAVTKEDYGFRVTSFSVPVLQALSPTLICMLYVEPSIIEARVKADSEGRQPETIFEADAHRNLQATVALVYGIMLGVPIHLLDSSRPTRDIVTVIARRLQNLNPQTVYSASSL